MGNILLWLQECVKLWTKPPYRAKTLTDRKQG